MARETTDPNAVRAWVGLGANLDQPILQLAKAVELIGDTPGVTVTALSSLYISAPVGYVEQPDFFNAVCEITTRLEARVLLDCLLGIEDDLGRVRNGPRFGPRRVDLDLLLYGDSIVQSRRLTLPHPRMAERRFVLAPLVEVAPDVVIPEIGRATDRLSAVKAQEVTRLQTTGEHISAGTTRYDDTVMHWPGPCRSG